MKFNLQVKSSQVKSCSNFDGGRARRLWGARRRDRSGGRGAAQLAWLESPEPGLYPHRLHVFFLIIAGAPQVTIFVPFSGCLLYGDAKPIQADVGSDRGPAQGLFRWATVLVPSRVWSTASAARPPPTSLAVLGQTRARQSFWTMQRKLARRRQERSRVFQSAPRHPARAPRMRACT